MAADPHRPKGATGHGRRGSAPALKSRRVFADGERPPTLLDTLFTMRGKLGIVFAFFVLGTIAIALLQLTTQSKKQPSDDTRLLGQSAGATKDIIPPRQVALKFLDAPTHEERLRWVREPGDAPLIEQHFESIGQNEEAQRGFLQATGQEQFLDVGYHVFHVRFKGGSNRLLCVVDEPGGRVVDWPAYARAGSDSWETILDGKVPGAEVRVFVQQSNYFNFQFQEAQKNHVCYALTSPDLAQSVHGYVRKGSRTANLIAMALEKMTEGKPLRNPVGGLKELPEPRRRSLPPQRMTLRIALVDQSHTKRQFSITRIVAAGWVASRDGDLETQWIPDGAEEQEEEVVTGIRDAMEKLEKKRQREALDRGETIR
ncbi:MAG: hypothetical protein ACI9R3_001560 [Verrucomicrobiales bacterium]|jgi:hypothetical protein